MNLDENIQRYIKELTAGCYDCYMLLLDDICKKLDITCFETDFEDESLSGQICSNNGSYSIYVNRKHPAPRQRFTIAHEIGHYISFKKGSYSESEFQKNDGYEDYALSYRQEGKYSLAETEANLIAAEMLMPVEKVDELLKQKLTPEEMADLFYVSPSAMTIRLSALYPNLMVI